MKNKKKRIIKEGPLPQKNSKKPHFKNLLNRLTSFEDNHSKDSEFKKYFFGSAVIIFILILGLAFNSSINGDDYFQNSYSDNITSFYTSFGEDTSCFNHPTAPIQYYGGLFELISGSINQGLGLDIYDSGYHDVRHIINALFGFCCVLILGYWLKLSGGWLLATLGLWLIFFSPRFIGHSLMNPKDIPFAAGYLISIFFLSKLLREFPSLRLRSLIGLSVGIGITTGIRIGGLILFGYVGLFLLIHLLKNVLKHKNEAVKNIFIPSLKIGVSLVIGLCIGLIFWPYGLVDPLHHIPETLSGITKISVQIKMLFQGVDFFGSEVPWYYHPLWIFQTIPVSILLGALLAIVFIKSIVKTVGFQDLVLAGLVFVFPVLYIIWQDSTLYDGWRHIIFVYPPLVFIAASGWYTVIKKYFHKKIIRYLLISVMILSMAEAGVFMMRNTSYPYVYFSPITGGISSAMGWYEMDYWGLSAGEAAKWMIDSGIINQGDEEKITVVSNFEYPVSVNLSKFQNVDLSYIKYRERHFKHWDYGIFVCRFVPGIQLRKGLWPPSSQEIYAVKANGVKLAVVLKNEDDAVFRGDQALQKGEYQKAIDILLIEVQKHPENEFIWIDMGFAYQYLLDYKSAEDCLNKALIINPHSNYANNFLAYNYLLEGKYDKSLNHFQKTLDYNKANDIANFYLAQLYEKKGELNTALTYGLRAIEINNSLIPAYETVAIIYDGLGNVAEAKKYREAAARLQ